VATVSNAAVGATGPELGALCVGTLFAPAALAAADVVVVEYAVNTDGGAQCVRQIDRLLWRLRRLAPRAAIVFLHAYSLSKVRRQRGAARTRWWVSLMLLLLLVCGWCWCLSACMD
jgi:hypothetical protein